MPNADRLETYATQYFTGAQATVWIGDVWVDEVFGIQYSASQSVIPIFGYASSFFDAVARGKVLVHGIFEINFVDEGYLYAVLNERAKMIAGDKETNDIIAEARRSGQPVEYTAAVAGRRTAHDAILDEIQLLKEVSQGNLSDSSSRRQTMGSVMSQIAKLDLVGLSQMASELNRNTDPQPSRNIIYEMVPFTLKGYFGNPELGGADQGTVKELKDCFLVNNEMVIGGPDEIVRERYSFIARSHV